MKVRFRIQWGFLNHFEGSSVSAFGVGCLMGRITMGESPDHSNENGASSEDAPKLVRPDSAIELGRGIWVMPGDVEVRYSRSSGPGGQSVNKVNTKADLRVSVEALQNITDAAVRRLKRLAGQKLTQDGEILIQAETHRSQRDNREACFERLRDLVTRAATPPKRRKKTRPSRAAKEKRLKEKKERGEKKQRRQWRRE